MGRGVSRVHVVSVRLADRSSAPETNPCMNKSIQPCLCGVCVCVCVCRCTCAMCAYACVKAGNQMRMRAMRFLGFPASVTMRQTPHSPHNEKQTERKKERERE